MPSPTILVAEGKKQSAILDAEAEKQAAILRAEAQKERMIKEAEGQAEAVLKVQNANAEGIRMDRIRQMLSMIVQEITLQWDRRSNMQEKEA